MIMKVVDRVGVTKPYPLIQDNHLRTQHYMFSEASACAYA